MKRPLTIQDFGSRRENRSNPDMAWAYRLRGSNRVFNITYLMGNYSAYIEEWANGNLFKIFDSEANDLDDALSKINDFLADQE